ncbi:TolC family protein [Pantoea coffeiphila]|uniref:TolC family protein n=1 Tax=Pantoea coffeiphila TaxID=1465635 RepID=UPI0019621811|nr:TolC family protein [Pantoea coffeiphila]MBM7341798.1 outer membrane protein TolC [Pantoea coffeiphila]
MNNFNTMGTLSVTHFTSVSAPVQAAFSAPRRLSLAVALACSLLAGCAVTPEAMTPAEQVTQAMTDRTQMFSDQEPVRGNITLDEAIARALKYNLQQRVALMEQAMQDDLRSVASLDMLPKLAARAGLQTRDNVAGSSSQSVTTGQQSLESSTSQDQTTRTADLTMSWNVLDFGISYMNAHMQANKTLAAEERRRKVVADITRQVRTAWWEAATAQRLKPEVTRALGEAKRSLEYARATELERLLPPVESLRFQKNMLEMVRQLEVVDSDLALAKARLSSLMNLPPASDFSLVVPAESSMVAPKMSYTLGDLENISMVRRPEIREESYEARNAVLETRRSLLRLMPGATLFAGVNGDSNSYLVNHGWASAGVQVSGNLLNVLAWSSVKRAGESAEQVAEARRQAMRMAVMAQVNVSWQEYLSSVQMFNRYQELARVQQGIYQQTDLSYRNQAATQMEQIRVSTETILTTRARDRSFAVMQNAVGSIWQAAGLDILPDRVNDTSLAALSSSINSTSKQIENGAIAVPALGAPTGNVTTAAPSAALLAASRPAPAPTPAQQAVSSQPYAVSSGNMWDSYSSLSGGAQ